MTTAGAAPDPIFVDTNILVFANTATAPMHATAVATLQALNRSGIDLWISRQTFREYLATLSRPQTFSNPVPVATLAADVIRFQSEFFVAEDGPAVTANLLSLLASVPCGGRQVYDANIVATMLAHGIPRLLTHNVADFARFGSRIAILPLGASP